MGVRSEAAAQFLGAEVQKTELAQGQGQQGPMMQM